MKKNFLENTSLIKKSKKELISIITSQNAGTKILEKQLKNYFQRANSMPDPLSVCHTFSESSLLNDFEVL